MDNLELQAKCINKILKQNIGMLNDDNIKNKISYFLWKEDKTVVKSIFLIDEIYKIVDLSLSQKNYKKALRFVCIMQNKINKLISFIQNSKV